jgi:hypothetical protein
MKKLLTILVAAVLLSCLSVLVNCENKGPEDVPEDLRGTWTAEKENDTKTIKTDFTLYISQDMCRLTIAIFEKADDNMYQTTPSSTVESSYACHYFKGALWIKTASDKANAINSTYLEAKVSAQDILEYNSISYKKNP